MREPAPYWQKILAEGLSSVDELLDYLQLPAELGSISAERVFKTRVPRGFAARMQPGNPTDPLLLQVLAQQQELEASTDYVTDPLQEMTVNPVPGLIHKYYDRVLLTLTGICAINCRFCFRRHFPYADNNPGQTGWQKACDYIAAHPSIQEVILSGGDPLLASDQTLAALLKQLSAIPHVQTVRLHTRIPIVLPERIQPELLALLNTQRFKIVVVVHCNHPQELDSSVENACMRMKQAGWTLLNQSVLLKGVNDDPAVLTCLSRRLFEYGVLPYYLHVLDKVIGTQHFDLPLARAQDIFKALQQQLPGYLLPRLVREEPEVLHKTILSAKTTSRLYEKFPPPNPLGADRGAHVRSSNL
jgi:EF-P beta-lysylation protein EpmB